jgi:hypothetical protein
MPDVKEIGQVSERYSRKAAFNWCGNSFCSPGGTDNRGVNEDEVYGDRSRVRDQM